MSYFDKCNTLAELNEAKRDMISDINLEWTKRKTELATKGKEFKRVPVNYVASLDEGVPQKMSAVNIIDFNSADNIVIVSRDGISI